MVGLSIKFDVMKKSTLIITITILSILTITIGIGSYSFFQQKKVRPAFARLKTEEETYGS